MDLFKWTKQHRELCMSRALKSGKISHEEAGKCRAILLQHFAVRKRSFIRAWWKGGGRREAKTIIVARKNCSADRIKLGIRKASGKCSLFFVVTSYSAKKWFLLFITTMFRFLVVAFWKDILLYLWDRWNYKKTVFLCQNCQGTSLNGRQVLALWTNIWGGFSLLLLEYIMVKEWKCVDSVSSGSLCSLTSTSDFGRGSSCVCWSTGGDNVKVSLAPLAWSANPLAVYCCLFYIKGG